MKFELPALPYAMDALEPVISQRTLHHHYEKHHAGYVNKLEAALDGASADKTLEEIIVESEKSGNAAVFNSAAQIWNHTFYWHSLTPDPSPLDDQRLIDLINASFGDVEQLKEKLKAAATGQFGSGWAWLLHDPEKDVLTVTSTTDAVTPLTGPHVPLLTIDVWEHAYYLDYQQDRAGYVDGIVEKLLNWQFAESNLRRE